MTKTFAWAILLLIASPLAAGIIQFNAVTPAGGGFSFTDDFNRGSIGGDWNDVSSAYSISGSAYLTVSSSATIVHTTTTADRTQWACVEKESGAGTYGGLKFRLSNTSDTGVSYVLRWNSSSFVAFRYCTGTSCNNVGSTWANGIGVGEYICGDVRYTGADTEMAAWDMGGGGPGARGSWGDADHCWCSSGTCVHPDCGTATKDSSSPGSVADCSTEATCYVGLYTGDSTATGFDNYSAGVDGS